jgi:hypothetical protein
VLFFDHFARLSVFKLFYLFSFLFFLSFSFCLLLRVCSRIRSFVRTTKPSSTHQQGYKSLLRRELQAEFERRQLSDQFFDQNRDQIFADKKVVAFETPTTTAIEENRVSIELTEAVPPTETLNVEAQRARADLARQGSLADRNPPAGLAQVRAKQQAAPQHLAFEPDVTYDDGEPVLDGLDQNSSPVSPKNSNTCTAT